MTDREENLDTDDEDYGRSHWNDRVIHRTHEHGEHEYAIHEVHYRDDKVWAWTESPVAPSGESIEELREQLQRFLFALDRPILVETKRSDGSDCLVEENAD